MYGSMLAARGGVTLSRPLRSLAFLTLLVCSFFGLTVFQTQDRAYAFVNPIPMAFLPGSLAPAVVSGAGEVGAVLAVVEGSAAIGTSAGVGTAAAAAGASVAVAPAALAVGATLLAGTAVYLGWKWASGHTGAEYDAAASGAFAGGWSYTRSLNGSYWRYAVTVGTPPAGYAASFIRVVIRLDGNYQGSTSPVYSTSSPTLLDVVRPSGSFATPEECILTGADQYSALKVIAFSGGEPSWCQPYTNGGSSATPQAATTGATGTNVATTTPKSVCSNGSTVSGTAVTYTGSTASGSLPPLVLPACPAGTTRTGAQFPTTATGVSSPAQPLANWSAPTIPTGFPECNTVGKLCQLVLTRLGFATGVRSETCDTSGNCADWQRETVRQGQAVTVKTVVATTVGGVAKSPGDDITEQPRTFPNGDTLSCSWGPYKVPVDECKVVPTETPGEAAGGGSRRCYPTGWAALNPLEWVVKPLKCLFIPDEAAVRAAGESISEAWSGTAPAVVSSKVGQVVAPIVSLKDDTGPTSCEGPSFVIPQLPTMPSTVVIHPMSTCNELTQYLLGIYLPIASALIYVGGFFAGTRVILKAFNLDTGEAV